MTCNYKKQINDSITVCSWNCNGALISKKATIEDFLDRYSIDILLINETKLIKRDKFNIKNYAILRTDRDDKIRAGGVIALIHKSIPYLKCKQLTISNFETISFIVKNTIITAAYNPPNNHFNEQDLDQIFSQGSIVWLIGDLNSKHTIWNNNRNNINGTTLKHYIDKNALSLAFTDSPTHFPSNGQTPSTIDILVTKNTSEVIKLEQYCCLDSDHNPVFAKMAFTKQALNRRRIRTFKNTNWADFRSTINTTLTINNNLDTSEKIENTLNNFTNILSTAINKHSKTILINNSYHKLPTNIIELIKLKNKARKLFQSTRSIIDKQTYYRLVNEVKQLIKENTNNNWKKFLSNLSPKDNSLWQVMRKFTKKSSDIPTLVDNNDISFTLNKDKCNLFAKTFSKTHQLDPLENNSFENEIIDQYNIIEAEKLHLKSSSLSKIYTNPSELKLIIKKLKNNKAPGADGIANIAIKNLPNKAICQLMYIINAIMKLQYFPSSWKLATIIPIHKSGKSDNSASSYRPISLLPCLAKIAERVISDRLNSHTKKARILPDFQFGFRQKLGTENQLVRIINDISMSFNQKRTTVMLLYDVEKAFDRVWSQALITKLLKFKYPLYLIKLLQSYLKNRKFVVRVGDSISNIQSIEAGVPQGSVLGPSLFTIYISDIPTLHNTKIAQFADDTAIYAESFSAEIAYRKLMIHNRYLQDYFKKWKIKLNNTKTEIIIFTKKFTDIIIHSLKTPNADLKPVKQVKYLGMILDSRLSFVPHITKAVKAAYAAINRLYPLINSKSYLSLENKLLLYKSAIRPILTYAAPAWCSASDTALKRLQIIQNKCLRIITGSERYTKIAELHEMCNNLQFLKDFIVKLSLAFYTNRIQSSVLTKNLIRSADSCKQTDGRIIHKLPYSRLLEEDLL